MKKIFTLAAIALFTLASCSDDDATSTTPDTSNVLVKKRIDTDEDGEQFISTYQYSGNKIATVDHNDGSNEIYTYTGENLTKVDWYEDGVLVQKDVFTYNSDNKVATFISYNYNEDPQYNGADKYTYTYNANGTVTVVEAYGDHTEQNSIYQTATATLVNGNLVSYTGSQYSAVYTFDDKNAPFKNVQNYQNYVLSDLEGGLNNELSYTYTSNGYDENSQYVYEYNEAGFPVKVTETDDFGDVYVTQYIYE